MKQQPSCTSIPPSAWIAVRASQSAPSNAIFPADEVPADKAAAVDKNAEYYQVNNLISVCDSTGRGLKALLCGEALFLCARIVTEANDSVSAHRPGTKRFILLFEIAFNLPQVEDTEEIICFGQESEP